jgi:hypothetical protein
MYLWCCETSSIFTSIAVYDSVCQLQRTQSLSLLKRSWAQFKLTQDTLQPRMFLQEIFKRCQNWFDCQKKCFRLPKWKPSATNRMPIRFNFWKCLLKLSSAQKLSLARKLLSNTFRNKMALTWRHGKQWRNLDKRTFLLFLSLAGQIEVRFFCCVCPLIESSEPTLRRPLKPFLWLAKSRIRLLPLTTILGCCP